MPGVWSVKINEMYVMSLPVRLTRTFFGKPSKRQESSFCMKLYARFKIWSDGNRENVKHLISFNER